MNENFDAFDEYAMTFDMNEDMIKYKYNHSYRVVHQCEEIARSLKLEEEKKDIASLIGLLHDYARFEQWTKYKTFNDSKSFDHGDRAVELLFDENHIKNFNYDEKYKYCIIKAIKNHNKILINDKTMSFDELLFSKIVRDADKIDILYAFSTNRLLEIKDDESEISQEVSESIMNHEQVNKKYAKTKNDSVLMMMALVFDLNYDYSKERVYEEEYINKMYNSLKNKDKFKKYVDEVNDYLKGEVNNVRKEI